MKSKKQQTALIAFLAAMLVPTTVAGGVSVAQNAIPTVATAAEDTAITAVSNETELREALKGESAGGIQFTADIIASDMATFEIKNKTLDLGGHTLTLNGESGTLTDSTIKNGTIAITTYDGDTVADGLFDVEGTESCIEDVTFTSEKCAIYAIFDLRTGNLTMKSCAINVNNNTIGGNGGLFFANGSDTLTLTMTDCTVDCTDIGDFITNGTAVLTNCNITLKGTVENALDNGINGAALTLDNTTLTVDGATGRGITTDSDAIVIKNNSSVTLTNCAEGGIRYKASATITVDDSSTLSGTVKVDEAATEAKVNETAIDVTGEALLKVKVEQGTVTVKEPITGLSGEGTAESPYLINNVDELIWFRDQVNTYTSDGSNQYKGKYVKLTADIDLAGENWTPIGTNSVGDHMAFLGTFDGDGHTISNLYINADGGHLGFFARVGNYSEDIKPAVKNLTFHNVDVSTNITDHWTEGHGDNVGGVIANAGGNSVVSGIKVTGDVYIVGCSYVGGIVGHGYPDIDNCSLEANKGSYINCGYWCAGGIIGYAGEGGTPITNASVSGVKVWSAYGAAAAVAGLLQDGNTLKNVSASNVEITSASDYCMGYVAGNGEASTMTDVTIQNVTATANGKPITSTDAVASIGETFYFNLEEALEAAQADDTVDLLGGTFTDVAGFSLNGITLANGSIVFQKGARIGVHNAVVLDNVDLTFDMEGTSGYPNTAIYVNGGSATSLTLKNGSDVCIKNPGYTAIYNDSSSAYTLNIDNSTLTIEGKGSQTGINSAKITLTNEAKLNTSNTGIAINGGSVKVDGNSSVTVKDANSHGITNVVLTVEAGGVVDVDNCAYLGLNIQSGSSIAEGAVVTVDNCGTGGNYVGIPARIQSGVTGYENILVNEETLVARLANGNAFTSLAKAFEAAQEGDTVQIFAGTYDGDVSVNKAITVIGATDAEGNNLVTINGKLSVTGTGVTVKNLNVKNESERALYVSGGGILIEGCNLTGTHGLRYCYANNGDVTLKDCVITGSTYGVHFDGGTGEGKVIIDGCTITGWTSFGSAVEGVTITDTTFEDGNYNLLRFYQNAKLENVTIPSGDASDYAGSGMRIDVGNGGTGMEGVTVTVTNCKTADGSSLEGAFPGEVIIASDIVIDGVTLVRVASITVVDAATGEDTTTYYATFKEAFEAAKAGDTVTLVANVENAGSLSIPAGVTLDGAGYTISGDTCVHIHKEGGTIQNVNFKDIHNDAGKLSAIYATGLVTNAEVTITGCTFENIDWDAMQITSVNDSHPTVTITGNTFLDDTDDTVQQQRHIHVELGTSTRSKVNLTIEKNKFYGADVVAIGAWYIDPVDSTMKVSYNYVEYPELISICYNTAQAGSYNVNELALPLVEEDLETEINYGFKVLTSEYNSAFYATLEAAIEAAEDGQEVVILEAGTYKLPSFGKDLTITGAVDGVVIDNNGAVALNGANVVFNNITFDYYPNKNYTGLQHVNTVTYNNCTFNGQVFLYGAKETFNDCWFHQESADAYNVWTYGAKEVAFNDCLFFSVGKSVLVYNEGACATDFEATGCYFKASDSVEGKAAIEIDTSLMPGQTSINVSNSSATGFDAGSVSGNSLWNNKKGLTASTNDLTVTVDGAVKLAPVTANLTYGGYVGTSGEGERYRENIQIDLYGVRALESLVVKLYSGDELLSETTLRETDRDDATAYLYPASGSITANIVVKGRSAGSWDTVWHKDPSVAFMPTKIEVYADGILCDTWGGNENEKFFINEVETKEFTALTGVYKAAAIGDTYYATLEEAVKAAQDGDTIEVLADLAGVAITVDKNITITGETTLNNVSITANGADKLTVSGLTFTGNSWINSGSATELTVSGVTATVTPVNSSETNSRSAFIALGRSEQQQLALTVEDSTFVVSGGGDPILGWATITEATISGNTFGSEENYIENADAVKFMAIAEGAKIEVSNNTVYSNYNGFVFGQNTTRDNAYTVNVNNNAFYGSADHVWVETSGVTTTHATVNATSDNTVNGNAFTAADIKTSETIWTSYAGVDVVVDEDGKVIGGTLASFANQEVIAEGYGFKVNEDGTLTAMKAIVAVIYDANGNAIFEATGATLADVLDTIDTFAALGGDSATIEVYADQTVDTKAVVNLSVTINGNGHTLTYTGTDRAITVESDAAGVDLTIKDLTIAAEKAQRGINYNTNGDLTLENVYVTAGTYAVNLPGSSDNANVTIEGGSYTAKIALNVWGENSTINVTNAALTSIDETEVENYAAIQLNNDGTTAATGTTVTVTGGSITALDQNGEPAAAVSNWTDATVEISDTTVVKGAVKQVVAMINGYGFYTLQDALDYAASKEQVNIVIDLLADTTLDITSWDTLAIGGDTTETITINGNGKTLTFNQKDSDWNNVATKNGAKLILNDMAIANSGYNDGPWNRYDINFACDVELNNVTSNKALAFKADATLNDVTINESGDNYAIWIQANGQQVSIDGLTVNSVGRGIKIDEQYVDAAGAVALSVENATFTTAKKSAILVKSAAGAAITTENVDITGVAADSTNAVWIDEDAAAYFGNVTVNGGAAVLENADAFIVTATANGVLGYYKTLEAAITAADENSTITLLDDFTSDQIIALDKSITLDGSGYTLDSTAEYAFNIGKEGKVVDVAINNLTVAGSENTERGINMDYAANLTLYNVNVNAKYAVNVSSLGAGSRITINGGEYSGYAALNIWGEGTTVTVKDATLIGNNTYANSQSNTFATIAINDNNNTVTVSGGKIEANSTQGADQYILVLNSSDGVTGSAITLDAELSYAESGKGILSVNEATKVAENTVKVSADYADRLRAEGYTVSDVTDEMVSVTGVVFMGMNLTLGSDLTVNYYVNLTEEEAETAIVTFELLDKTVEVEPIFDAAQGSYVFKFEHVAPHQMGATITATLTIDGKECGVKTYSVKEYCYDLLGKTAEELGYENAPEKYAAIRTLIADLLNYGAVAQEYAKATLGEDTGELVNAELEEGIASEFTNLTTTDLTLKNNTGDIQITSVGLYHGTANKMRFKFKVAKGTDTTNLHIVIVKGADNVEGEYTLSDCEYIECIDEDLDYTYYYAYTKDILSTEFDTVYTVRIYNGTSMTDYYNAATVTFSVNSYVYIMQTAGDIEADFVKALYCYGASADKFVAIKE